MVTPLLDVNVLIALSWPTHLHHPDAVAWFTARGSTPWATTTITQLGFIRVSSNRSVLPDARSPSEAAAVLRALTELEGHEYWPDDLEPAQSPQMHSERIIGHRQVTDAHLLALAQRHDGCVATFDRAMATLAQDTRRVHVLGRSD